MERTLTWPKYKRCTLINIPHSFLSILCCLYCHCFHLPNFYLLTLRIKALALYTSQGFDIWICMGDQCISSFAWFCCQRYKRAPFFSSSYFLWLILSFRLIQTHCYLLWVNHCLSPLWIILKILSSAWLVLFVPLHKNVIECYMNELPFPSLHPLLSHLPPSKHRVNKEFKMEKQWHLILN